MVRMLPEGAKNGSVSLLPSAERQWFQLGAGCRIRRRFDEPEF